MVHAKQSVMVTSASSQRTNETILFIPTKEKYEIPGLMAFLNAHRHTCKGNVGAALALALAF
jgi:hypothetical protein